MPLIECSYICANACTWRKNVPLNIFTKMLLRNKALALFQLLQPRKSVVAKQSKKHKYKKKLKPGGFHTQHEQFFKYILSSLACIQCAHTIKAITNWTVDKHNTPKISAALLSIMIVHSLVPPF